MTADYFQLNNLISVDRNNAMTIRCSIFLFQMYFLFFSSFFFNEQTIIYYIKLKLQQNGINKKTLHKAETFLSVKNQKNKTTTKTKQTIATTTKNPKETHKNKIKKNIIKRSRPRLIFPNDFLHVVYLLPHQKLLSTIHLRYWNYFICQMPYFF